MSSNDVGLMISYAPPDRRWKPSAEAATPAPPHCPRCDSPNTKFCYYNNYSLSQPRYFCKGCRRYWTKGGSLRNVPVGGGCRKSRRGKSLRLSAPPPHPARRSPSLISRPSDLLLHDEDDRRRNHTGTPAAAAIDLEALYAKYLNRADPPEPPSAAATSSESSCGPIPLQFPTGGQPLPLIDCRSAVAHQPLMEEETLSMSQINDVLCNFSVDPSGSSLALLPPPPEALFDCPTKDSSSINYDEFEPFPVLTTCTQQHQQGLMVEEDEWSAFDYSTLEAFYRC